MLVKSARSGTEAADSPSRTAWVQQPKEQHQQQQTTYYGRSEYYLDARPRHGAPAVEKSKMQLDAFGAGRWNSDHLRVFPFQDLLLQPRPY
jgi:hypothetical protein